MSNLFCPIERGRRRGKKWSRCAILTVCPYANTHPPREVDSLFTGNNGYNWPMVNPSCDEEWSTRPPIPERGSGDEDRITAELNDWGETAMYFIDEEPIILRDNGVRVIKADNEHGRMFIAGLMPVLSDVEDITPPGHRPGSHKVFYPSPRMKVLGWKPVSRPQGGTRCPMYKPAGRRGKNVGRRCYHKQWGIVRVVKDDGDRVTVVKTGNINKRVMKSHLRPL